ncbi:MAG: hydrolase TatD [Bdellovibrionaceae bacterium]|nr:hydrolase TatD [Pseudobdellovibrionaceae bacterium]|tara:strand:- start:10388 stop:11161 length:774 start_codon:yes stop_codon:yes gene_type:complete
MGWLDMHAHINMLEVSEEECLKTAKEAGVDRIITIGTCPDDNPLALDIARRNFPTVHCCLGMHPHDAKDWDEKLLDELKPLYQEKEVVGVGEIGLDYYYDNSPRELQKSVFRKMLQMAKEVSLPVQIHTRDADDDTVEILKEFEGQVKGIIHCFTGTQELAHRCLDLGYNISISGVVTFKNAEALRETVRSVPLDRLHVETDAPFLAPVPHRGKKNQPSFVINTAEKVAELKGISLEQLQEQTQQNAQNLFTKIQWN